MVVTQFAPIHAQEHLAKITNIPLSQTLAILHRGESWGTRDLLSKLLQPDYPSRYTVVKAIRHPWTLARPGSAAEWLDKEYAQQRAQGLAGTSWHDYLEQELTVELDQ
jgi:serine/threonine protein kinase